MNTNNIELDEKQYDKLKYKIDNIDKELLDNIESDCEIIKENLRKMVNEIIPNGHKNIINQKNINGNTFKLNIHDWNNYLIRIRCDINIDEIKNNIEKKLNLKNVNVYITDTTTFGFKKYNFVFTPNVFLSYKIKF
jgi:hypothetical protein